MRVFNFHQRAAQLKPLAQFLAPVRPGDALQVALTAKEINPRGSAEHGEVRWDCQVTNQTGALVARYDVLTMVAKTSA